jgi:hypothetical protein
MNNHEPPREWLDAALREHFAAVEPSETYLQRCRSAALGALDVLKMQECRQEWGSEPGSLVEHIRSLARHAGVQLQAVLQAMGITAESDSNATSASGWTQLAHLVAMDREEAILRWRWGFARSAGVVELEDWPDIEPVRARGEVEPLRRARSLAEILRRAEAGYSSQRRAELRAAINAVERVYDMS